MTSSKSQFGWLAAAAVAVLTVGAVDYVTGEELGLSLFYLAPVAAATWQAGRVPGVVIALGSAAVWYAADLAVGHSHSDTWIPIWNAGVRLGFFLVVVELLSRLEHEFAERRRLLNEVRATLAQVRTLSGLVPICAWCKNVRDDEGFWSAVEAYVAKRTDASFTHGLCPECAQRLAQEAAEVPPASSAGAN